MMQEWDQNSIDFAMEKGEAKGEAKGVVKGEAKRAAEIARRMLSKDYPIAEIADISSLSEEQVRALM